MERNVVRVADVMESDYVIIDGVATVAEALEVLRERNAHFLIVDKRHQDDEYGIVVRSDITKKVLARDRAPERVNIYEIMSKPVISVRPDMDVRYCARLFERFGLSVAPVVENGEIIGIVGYKGLLLHGLLKLYS